MADTEQMATASTADDSAREAQPATTPEGTPFAPVRGEEHPSSAASDGTSDPYDQVRSYLDTLPEDAIGRLAKEHPRLRSTFDQETRTLLQRKEAERFKEQQQREALEAQQREQQALDHAYDLIASDDPDADPVEVDEARKRVSQHRQYQRTREAVLKDSSTQTWAVRQAGEQISLQMRAHAELAKYWDAAKADEAPDYADLAWRLAEARAKSYLAEREEAIRADERDKRLRGLPNPDTARSAAVGQPRTGWTAQRYQLWLRTHEGTGPTPAEIDALTASYQRGA